MKESKCKNASDIFLFLLLLLLFPLLSIKYKARGKNERREKKKRTRGRRKRIFSSNSSFFFAIYKFKVERNKYVIRSSFPANYFWRKLFLRWQWEDFFSSTWWMIIYIYKRHPRKSSALYLHPLMSKKNNAYARIHVHSLYSTF